LYGQVQVVVLADFDRWANSVDFVFSIPKTQRAFDAVIGSAVKPLASAMGR
jgi:hypothetical protein